MTTLENREIEVKFLEVDKNALIEKLNALHAVDLGEELITEQIFHDAKGEWPKDTKFGRIRKTKNGYFFAYKHSQQRTATGVLEIEFNFAGYSILNSISSTPVAVLCCECLY